MKRFLSVFLICIGVFLMSCSSDGVYSVDMQYEKFDFYGECTVNGETYAGHFYIGEGKELAERERYIILSAPDTLSGIRIDVAADGVRTTCDGISVPAEVGGILRVFELFDIPKSAVFHSSGSHVSASLDGTTYETVYEGGRIKSISAASGTDIISVRIEEIYG